MFAGHFAAGLLAKRAEPSVSLGLFVLAAMLSDLLWCVFMIAGFEHVEYRPGRGAADYLASWYVPFSHSLAMNLLWAAALALAYVLLRRRGRAAWLLFALVLSHWFLDIVTDRSVPTSPGMQLYVGANLWRSLPATLAIEGGLWLAAVSVYVQGTRAGKRAGLFGFWIGVALITLIWYGNITGPPPSNPRIAPIVTLIISSALVGRAFWMNRAASRLSLAEFHHQAPATQPQSATRIRSKQNNLCTGPWRASPHDDREVHHEPHSRNRRTCSDRNSGLRSGLLSTGLHAAAVG
jgi:hypothetical protein